MRTLGWVVTFSGLLFLGAAPVSGAPFIRGDANVDGSTDITDAIVALGFLFLGDPPRLDCEDAADANDDGALDISDSLFLLSALFLGDAPPPPPTECGDDPTDDALGCESFEPCPDVDVLREITCENPGEGAMVEAAPGSSILFRGRVSDPATVASVRVDGVAVSVDRAGGFQRSVPVRYGVNFVEVRVEEAAGGEIGRTCSFLVAQSYAPEDEFLDDSILLALRDEAIDDGERSDLDSFGDLLGRFVSGGPFEDTVDQALNAANPLKDSCDIRDPLFNTCVFRSNINYTGGFTVGSAEASLSRSGSGLRIDLQMADVDIPLRIGGTVSSTGRVTVSEASADAVLEPRLVRGAIRMDLVSSNVSIGSISTDFSGLSGTILDVIASLADGQIRNLIRDVVQDFIREGVPELLTDALASIDPDSLGGNIQVQTFDGRDIEIALEVATSRVSTEPFGLVFGLGTRWTGDGAHSRPSAGIAMPSRAGIPIVPDGTAGVGMHVGFLNQVLHALWRSGVLDGTLSASDLGLGDLPGVEIRITSRSPPMAEVRTNDTVALMLAGLEVELDLGADPLTVSVAAILDAPVRLVGDEVSFGRLEIEELAASTDVGLDTADRALLEGLVTELVSTAADDLLGAALPSFPIPAFDLPASVVDFGVPAGTKLGLASPVLRTEAAQVILEGRFAAVE